MNELFASEQLVCIFPAGLVSRRTKGKIRDLEWKKTFVKQSKINDQLIVPVHIKGRLSNFFYRLANFRKFIGLKMNIEMLYLADELFKQKNQHIVFTVGEHITVEDLNEFKNDKQAAHWIQAYVMNFNESK